MKLLKWLLINLTFVLALGGGSIPVLDAHMIIRAKGKVELKEDPSATYRRTGPGERLDFEDVLWPAQNAEILVLCEDASIHRMENGVPSNLKNACQKRGDTDLPILRKGEAMERQPGGFDPKIPYIISPRMTYLKDQRPTLRWNQVQNARRYTVYLQGPGGVEWKISDGYSKTKLVYPKSARSLEYRVKYLVRVEADNGTSSMSDVGCCFGFEILAETHIQEISTKVEKINRLAQLTKLTKEEKVISIAYLYSQNNLISTAIEALEKFIEKGNKTEFTYRELGRLYARAGLNLLAKNSYSKALTLCKDSGNEFSLEKAHTELQKVVSMNKQKRPSEGLCDLIITPRD